MIYSIIKAIPEQTYAEMRSVAEDKYNLRLTESYLPVTK